MADNTETPRMRLAAFVDDMLGDNHISDSEAVKLLCDLAAMAAVPDSPAAGPRARASDANDLLVPNPCSICGNAITAGAFVGTGDGTMRDGGSFAHLECYHATAAQTPASPPDERPIYNSFGQCVTCITLETMCAYHRAEKSMVAQPAPASGGSAREADGQCQIPPAGWYCTRAPGHDGPCAARPVSPDDEELRRAYESAFEKAYTLYARAHIEGLRAVWNAARAVPPSRGAREGDMK